MTPYNWRVRIVTAAWHVLSIAICSLASVACFLTGNRCFAYERASLDLPKLMLWAWERPEDLSYVDARQVGFAYLAQTITLSGDRCHIRRRVQPLKLPAHARVEGVVRIEIDPRNKPTYSESQMAAVVKSVLQLPLMHEVKAVQIDFDARENERTFYTRLLSRLKSQLPAGIGLSITALASWCLYDRWLAELPVDEAVPMMFSMGRDHAKVLLHIQSGRDFAHAICNESLGISLDEPDVNAVMQQLVARQKVPPRVYIFSSKRWTKQSADRAVQFGDTKRRS